MMRKIHFSDHLEQYVSIVLQEAGIEFIHESEDKEQVLDFYLPAFDVYLEVKQFHSPRIEKQMASKDNVIALQGKKAVCFFTTAFKRSTALDYWKARCEAAEEILKGLGITDTFKFNHNEDNPPKPEFENSIKKWQQLKQQPIK